MKYTTENIVNMLDAIYKLSSEDKIKLVWIINALPSTEKDKLLMTVFKKYTEYEKSLKKLLHQLQITSNDLIEFEEHQKAEDILTELD